MKTLWMGCLVAISCGTLFAQPRNPADDWNDRGLAASARGDFAEAERLLRESLRLWQQMGPQYEAHAATVMMNLAEAVSGEGKWNDGAALLADALAINRRVLGPAHARTVANTNFLASADLILGDLEASNSLFQEALSAEREHFPRTSMLADTLMGISSYEVRSGRVADALPPAEEALTIAADVLGEGSINTAMAYANVAQVHTFLHNPTRALPLYRKAESIYAHLLSANHPRYASVLSQEGLALMEDGKLIEAGHQMTRAIEILSHCGGCQYQSAVAQSNLGWLRYREGKYADADRLLTSALELQETYSAHPGSEMAATLNRLADVRAKEHRGAEATQLRGRAATYR